MNTNGTIKILMGVTGGGKYPATGDPIASTPAWSDPVPCHIRTNTHNTKGKYVDGMFTVAKYEILIESQTFTGKRIKITNDRLTELGEFEVQDVQFLDSVGRVKIQV